MQLPGKLPCSAHNQPCCCTRPELGSSMQLPLAGSRPPYQHTSRFRRSHTCSQSVSKLLGSPWGTSAGVCMISTGSSRSRSRSSMTRFACHVVRQPEMCVIVDECHQVVGSATRKETGEHRLEHGKAGKCTRNSIHCHASSTHGVIGQVVSLAIRSAVAKQS